MCVDKLPNALRCAQCPEGTLDKQCYHALTCHVGLQQRHDALNRELSTLFHRAGRLKSSEPTHLFADSNERPDHYLLGSQGKDVYTDTSLVFARMSNAHIAMERRANEKTAKYKSKCRDAGADFVPLIWEAKSGGMSRDTVRFLKCHARMAGHRSGMDPTLAINT